MPDKIFEVVGLEYEETAPGYHLENLYDKEKDRYYTVETLYTEGVLSYLQELGIRGHGPKTAILDTGVMTHHPTIKKVLKESVNFTEEATVEDLHGHGSMVTMIMLAGVLDVNLYNVKVMNASLRGTKENLLKGIEWCIENDMRLMNMSLGVYSSTCEGNCIVCNAAKKALDKGIFIAAAAGNVHGMTACPAKLAHYGYSGIIAVGVDADYSGRGSLIRPETRLRFVEVE